MKIGHGVSHRVSYVILKILDLEGSLCFPASYILLPFLLCFDLNSFSFLFMPMHLFLQIEEANVFKESKQFTYKDGSQFVFMDLVISTIIICLLDR